MIKLSQKRTCTGCRLLQVSMSDYSCQVGVSIEVAKVWHRVPIAYKPLSPCYKPKTYDDMMLVLDLGSQR